MNKLHLASIIFLIVMVLAFIPLTVEIFGDMNTYVITVSAAITFVGLLGTSICSFIRAMNEWKNTR